jgi:hypothetical protein
MRCSSGKTRNAWKYKEKAGKHWMFPARKHTASSNNNLNPQSGVEFYGTATGLETVKVMKMSRNE